MFCRHWLSGWFFCFGGKCCGDLTFSRLPLKIRLMPEGIPKKSTASTAPIALTLFVMLIVAALTLSRRNLDGWTYALETISSIFHYLFYNVVPPLLVTVILYYYKRNSTVMLLGISLTAVYALTMIVRAIMPRSPDLPAGIIDHAIDFSQLLTDPAFIISLITLLSFRFRGTTDRARIAGLASIVLMALMYIASFWLHGMLFFLISMALNCATLVILSFCAWCIVFRRHDAPNRPPIDADRAIALTCPRCQSPQTIGSGHGECANCRLQITISLDEGVCDKCRYPLRGLTGDKCPECGTPIVTPPESAEPTVPAAH